MKVLLSPAKSLDFTKNYDQKEVTIPIFLNQADYLARKMQKMSAKKIGAMMHLSTTLADLNYERYQCWELPETPTANNLPCVFAFTGEVYKGLDVHSLSAEALQRVQAKIRILSGLYGLLKPLDLMYPYRLEMGTKWNITPKIQNLYAYWGTKIADQLNAEMKMAGEDVIINLASSEYFKAANEKHLKARVITPVFKEYKAGTYKIVMMYAKHARGAMARYIVQNDIRFAEDLKVYNVDGYTFDIHQSSENEWIFTR